MDQLEELMDPCEVHQVALERRLAGALPAAEAEELGRHLEGCADCRRYERHMERIQEMVETSRREIEEGHREPVSTDRVDRHVDASRDVARYSLATIFLLGFGLLVQAFEHGEGPGWVGLFAMVMSVLTIRAMARGSRSLRRLAEEPGDILELSRSDLRARVVFARALGGVLAFLGLLCIGSSVPDPPAWVPILAVEPGGVLWLVPGLALLAGSLASFLVLLPRFRRELSELE